MRIPERVFHDSWLSDFFPDNVRLFIQDADIYFLLKRSAFRYMKDIEAKKRIRMFNFFKKIN